MVAMPASRQPRRWPLAMALVFLVAVSVMYVTAKRTEQTPVERLVRSLVTPAEGVVSRSVNWVRNGLDSLHTLGTLRRENARLSAENEQIKARLNLVRDLGAENERLRGLLGFSSRSQYRLLAAEVIGRDPTNWFSAITINRGSTSGLRPGLPVITADGLVGLVRLVDANSATVLLLLDNKAAVGGRVEETGDFVLAQGAPAGTGTVVVQPLEAGASLRKGQTVQTSGLSAVFPKGVPIGKIRHVSPGKYGLSSTAELEPAVDFAHLEEVFVILQ